jgi:G-rich domain on putative tyrosine kinase
MRRVLRFLVLLYPRAWRARYKSEFEALLEDAGPRWRDLGDVVWGALAMQMRTWGFGKTVVALGLAGALAGAAGSLAIPDRFVSEAVVRYERTRGNDARLKAALMRAFDRQVLEDVIRREDLYGRELSRKQMDDAIEQMKRNIRVRWSGPATIDITFVYDDRYKTQRALADIVNLVHKELPAVAIEGGASLPTNPVWPNRAVVAEFGLGAGVLVGLLLGMFRRPANRLRATLRWAAALGLSGAAVGWGVSFAIPQRYVSTTVLEARAANGAADIHEIDQYLHELRLKVLNDIKDQSIAKMRRDIRIATFSSGLSGVIISFECDDRLKAQRVTALLASSAIEENAQQKPALVNLEIIDGPNLPQTPVSPKRPMVAVCGMGAGVLFGLVFSWSRRFRLGFSVDA